jgi:peptidoglycan/LPS O-acetylase OafA/YrhL
MPDGGASRPGPGVDRHIYGLDIVRFFAAVSVAAFHFTWHNPRSIHVAPWGWVGVEIFFVISGLVIARSARASSPARFAVGRFLRLYPAAWICAPLSAVVLLAMPADAYVSLGIAVVPTFGAFLSSLALFSPGHPFMASAYWTLPIELAFYALVGCVLFAGGRHRLNAVAGFLVLISAPYFVALIADALHLADLPWTNLGFGVKNLLLVRHGPYFALGMYLSLFSGPSTKALTPGQWLLASLAMLMAVAGVAVRAGTLVPGFAAPAAGAAVTALEVAGLAEAVFLAGFTALSLSVVFNDRLSPSPFARTCLRNMGLMTYPYYLLHETMGGVLLYGLRAADVPLALRVIVALVGVGVLALLATRWEDALRRRLKDALAWYQNGRLRGRDSVKSTV